MAVVTLAPDGRVTTLGTEKKGLYMVLLPHRSKT